MLSFTLFLAAYNILLCMRPPLYKPKAFSLARGAAFCYYKEGIYFGTYFFRPLKKGFYTVGGIYSNVVRFVCLAEFLRRDQKIHDPAQLQYMGSHDDAHLHKG